MGKPAGLDLTTLQALRAPARDLTLLVDRIAAHLDAHDGYVAFSGGKDSTVVLDLARRADPNVPVCFFDSGLEFPETLAYIDELTDRWNLNLHVIPTRPTALEYLQANGSWTHQPTATDATAAAGTMHQVLITEPAGQAHQRHGDGELWGIRAQESRGRRIMLLKALAAAIATDCARLLPTTGRRPVTHRPTNEHDTADQSAEPTGPSRSARCGTGPPPTSTATSPGTTCRSTRCTPSSGNSAHPPSCNASHPSSTPTASATAASSGSATAGPNSTTSFARCCRV